MQLSLHGDSPFHGVADNEHRDEDENCDGGPDEDDDQGGNLLSVSRAVGVGDD